MNPILLVALLTSSIFVTELGIMLLISRTGLFFSSTVSALIDSAVLIVVLSPIVYFLIYKRFKKELQDVHTVSDLNKAILSTIPFGMDIVDEEGNVLFLDSSLEKMFGKNAIGKKCWNLYRDNKQQCKDCPLLRGVKIGETSMIETSNCLGGHYLQISHTGMMFKDRKAILEIFQDITDRVMAQKAKEEFYSIVSHEIRAPLTMVKEGVDIVANSSVGELNEKQKELLDISNNNITRIINFVNNFLDSSQIESGKMVLHKDKINIAQLVSNIFSEFKLKALNKKLSFNLNTHGDKTIINADPDKIGCVVTNLISNAIKYTDQGSIDVNLRSIDDAVRFDVTNTGPTISEADIRNLFNKYHRLKSQQKSGEKGTGLGLYISKGIVELHDGKIWVESKDGKTTFSFTLPIER